MGVPPRSFGLACLVGAREPLLSDLGSPILLLLVLGLVLGVGVLGETPRGGTTPVGRVVGGLAASVPRIGLPSLPRIEPLTS